MIKKLKKAFTITELVIVIAVIAILAAVLIPTFSNVIENAKESAALQTSKNALTDYLATVTGDDNPNNDEPVGMVFVSDDYAHVYLNGSLHLIGKVGDLAYLDSSLELKGTVPDATNIDIGTDLTGDTIKISLAKNNDGSEKQEVDIAVSSLEQGTETEGEKTKQEEYIYFYRVNVNDKYYYGYFTLEQGNDPSLVTEGATYSRLSGYSQYKVSVTATTENVGG